MPTLTRIGVLQTSGKTDGKPMLGQACYGCGRTEVKTRCYLRFWSCGRELNLVSSFPFIKALTMPNWRRADRKLGGECVRDVLDLYVCFGVALLSSSLLFSVSRPRVPWPDTQTEALKLAVTEAWRWNAVLRTWPRTAAARKK